MNRYFWGPYQSHNKETGQSMVEFALIVGTLMLAIFTVIDLGRAMSAYAYLAGAAQAAARAGAVSNSSEVIEAAARTHMAGYGSESMTISIDQSGNYTEVTLTYVLDLVVPFVASAIGEDALVLSNTARIRKLGDSGELGDGGNAGSTPAASSTPIPATNTPSGPTPTPLPATNTPTGPTNTPQPPTVTPVPADTPVPTATECWPPGQCK